MATKKPNMQTALCGLARMIVEAAAFAACRKEMIDLLFLAADQTRLQGAIPAIDYIDRQGDSLATVFGWAMQVTGKVFGRGNDMLCAAHPTTLASLASTQERLNALASSYLYGTTSAMTQELIHAVVSVMAHVIEAGTASYHVASAFCALSLHGTSVMLPYVEVPILRLKQLYAVYLVLSPIWLLVALVLQAVGAVWRGIRGPRAQARAVQASEAHTAVNTETTRAA